MRRITSSGTVQLLSCAVFLIFGFAIKQIVGALKPQTNKDNIIISMMSENQKLKDMFAKAYAGDADAQYNLGFMYYNGKGVEQDYKKAYEWYSKSAEQDKEYEEAKKAIEKELAGIK